MSERGPLPVDRLAIVALFVTALITAQLTAAKLAAIPLPVSLPVTGSAIILPSAAAAYALTFFASDCYAELYGRRAAQEMVNVAFVMNFVVLGLLAVALWLPAANPDFAQTFAAALAPSANIVAGSLLAYLVSQNLDVITFHALRDRTEGAYLWLRNIASTATSQLVDTVIFIAVAFWVAPQVLGFGQALPGSVIAALVVGQYLFKLGIALLDTPFVYLVVGAARSRSAEDRRLFAD